MRYISQFYIISDDLVSIECCITLIILIGTIVYYIDIPEVPLIQICQAALHRRQSHTIQLFIKPRPGMISETEIIAVVCKKFIYYRVFLWHYRFNIY
jgi:hypothetical protein